MSGLTGYCAIAPGHAVHDHYHRHEYGVPLADETALFERLCLEIFQAGLSWEIILKKRPALVKAFHKFQVNRVSGYKAEDIKRLLADEGVIRNKLKIKAIIENAIRVKAMRKSHDGFSGFLAAHHPLTKPEWVKLFKKHFLFTGGEIVGEFLMSIGYLPGAHHPSCPIYKKLLKEHALPWAEAEGKGLRY